MPFGSSPLKDGLLRDELEWMQMLGVADFYSAVLRSGLDADAWCGGSFFKVLPSFLQDEHRFGFLHRDWKRWWTVDEEFSSGT